jgi:hypothetical protein
VCHSCQKSKTQVVCRPRPASPWPGNLNTMSSAHLIFIRADRSPSTTRQSTTYELVLSMAWARTVCNTNYQNHIYSPCSNQYGHLQTVCALRLDGPYNNSGTMQKLDLSWSVLSKGPATYKHFRSLLRTHAIVQLRTSLKTRGRTDLLVRTVRPSDNLATFQIAFEKIFFSQFQKCC